MQAQPGRVPPAAAAAPAAIAPPGRLHHPEVLDERAHRGQRHHEQAVCRDARVGFAISALLPSVFSRRVFFKHFRGDLDHKFFTSSKKHCNINPRYVLVFPFSKFNTRH